MSVLGALHGPAEAGQGAAVLRRMGSAYDALRDAGRDPFSVCFDAVLSPTTAMLDGRPMLLFGTNNYLGLTLDEACVAAAAGAARAAGTGTTGSRIANGSYTAHAALERALARFMGRAGAMVFTTGYQANLGALSALVGREDHLLLDADSHASLYDGARLGSAQVTRFRHNDPDDLARRLRLLERSSPGSVKLVVVEGLYSMLGDTARLREIVAAKREAGAFLLVDEAHSLGVYGENGRGLAEALGVEDEVDFVAGTFSKSLGAIGGYLVSNDTRALMLLRLSSRPYMFTASLPPSVIASVTQALSVMQARPELRHAVRQNGERLYAALSRAGFAVGPEPSPVVAVQVDGAEAALALWNRALEAGLYLNLALPPATPGDRAILRASVNAAHSAAEIDRAVALLAQAASGMGLLRAA